MDFNATIDLIIRELDEANEIMEDLRKIDGVPVLEIELAISKIKNAGKVIALLKEHHAVSAPKEESGIFDEQQMKTGHHAAKMKEEKVAEDKPVEQNAKTGSRAVEPEQEVKSSPQKKNEPERKQARHQDTLDIIPDEEKDPGKPDPESQKKPFVAPIVADTFSHLANRFNEQMGEKQAENFSYTHGRRYTSLIDAIGVNDRFYFIRELFNGDREAYNETITRLDKAADMNEAREIIRSFGNEKSSNEAANHLLELVKRKYTSHE